jgi:hypothetical protein
MTPDGPRIIPLNYAVDGDSAWFTTSAGSELARHGIDQTVAFEVDEIDNFLEAGWSVLAVGVAEHHRAALVPGLGPLPDTWVEKAQDLVIKLPWTRISGRRLHPA